MTKNDTLSFETEEDGGRGRILARGAQGEAELTYRLQGDKLIADHTGVPEAMGGRGVGTVLVERLYEMARSRGLKVVPACPFVEAKMAKHPEWQAVLAP